MPATEKQKAALKEAGIKAKNSIDNMQRHVIEGDDPIVLGKRSSAHIAGHLRNLVRLLEDVYKRPKTG